MKKLILILLLFQSVYAGDITGQIATGVSEYSLSYSESVFNANKYVIHSHYTKLQLGYLVCEKQNDVNLHFFGSIETYSKPTTLISFTPFRTKYEVGAELYYYKLNFKLYHFCDHPIESFNNSAFYKLNKQWIISNTNLLIQFKF